MTREELLTLVNSKLSGYKLTLSERTINEELDDVLDEFGEDTESNDKLAGKVAGRLKRMNGNLNAEVKTHVDDYKREFAKTQEQNRHQEGEKNPMEDEMPDWAKQLREELEAEREARKQRDAEESRRSLIASVKNGLKEKFGDANMKMNEALADIALEKMEIPSEGADVKALVAFAEQKYTSLKKAFGISDTSLGNGGGPVAGEKVDEHEFDDIKALASRSKTQASTE